ncbi:MAG: AbrB/MazE/SpoVT family DNA-binding domain-containing protein [Candidatus Hydrothermarchaeales archaeon]
MTDVVTIDKTGRLVIPKAMRDELDIFEGTKFLITPGKGGRLMLQKFDLNEIASKLEEEMKNVDIDAIVARVKKDINKKVRSRYPEAFD